MDNNNSNNDSMSKETKTKWIIAVVVAVLIIGFFVLKPKHLSGSYSHTINAIILKSTDTLKFDGDKVTEYTDGEKMNTGTYKIKGDQLSVKFGRFHINATLSDNKKSFVITSATGASDLASGFKYTKK